MRCAVMTDKCPRNENNTLTLSGRSARIGGRNPRGGGMPDGDVIPRTPVRLWKRPHTLLCTGADADVVADGVMHSLIASLRNKGGLPGARDLASAVQEFVAGKVGVADALAQLR